MRCLAFLAAKREFQLIAYHIRGVENILVDALSCNNLALFQSLNSQAAPGSAAIPEAVLDLTLLKEPDWTCRSWTGQWSTILEMD